ncbi:ATP-binding protein [Dysgonomonas sp. 216]|uniref:ATP-binding protein n=1 Tax=Dysgonomonas sp. 216 TaxID=2302934 RepID=UPI0013D2B89C|nr:ATP-binding protein [Dysgonomonas sp. 216]NDW19446.1 ATP-binding protein [Dysgonomonas sp. 216]
MSREFREFEFDEHNKKIFRFLLYYFNNSKLAEDVFKEDGEDYKIHKNLLLIGEPGTGKTIDMQVFSDYLKLTGNSNHFHNLSVTQMMNYYKMNGHIDRYTYNESTGSGSIEGNPFNVCLNDIGLEVENQKHYGTDLELVIDEFLYARYEIYQQHHIKYHMTSNLTVDEFKERFGNRLVDRFKSFNVLTLSGESRRK